MWGCVENIVWDHVFLNREGREVGGGNKLNEEIVKKKNIYSGGEKP